MRRGLVVIPRNCWRQSYWRVVISLQRIVDDLPTSTPRGGTGVVGGDGIVVALPHTLTTRTTHTTTPTPHTCTRTIAHAHTRTPPAANAAFYTPRCTPISTHALYLHTHYHRARRLPHTGPRLLTHARLRGEGCTPLLPFLLRCVVRVNSSVTHDNNLHLPATTDT